MKNVTLILESLKLGIINFTFTSLLLICVLTATGYAEIQPQPRPPLLLGQSVVTSFDPTINPTYKVVRVIDIRNKPPFITGGNYWNAPAEYAGADWTKQRMRSVYGIALDDASPPNIYVSSSTIYDCHPMSVNDSVLIYRIDGTTWEVTNYVWRDFVSGPPTIGVNRIPNTGPGMGNLCFDKQHNQILATNFEDGKIYRIGTGGIVLGTFDPFIPDSPSSGFAALHERLWGIGSYGTNTSNVKLYFGRWNADYSVNGQNEIWSITLSNTGEFIPTSVNTKPDIELPLLASEGPYSNPVADIEFAFDGNMLVGERSMDGICTHAHRSRILEYPRDASGNYNSYTIYKVGEGAAQNNSCGGVDFNFGISDSISNTNSQCDSIIVGTGDALDLIGVYGVQVYQRSMGSPPNFLDYCHFIDINGVLATEDKTTPGDVDVYRKDLCSDIDTNCIKIVSDTTYCDSTGTYIYEFKVHNNSPTKTVEQLEITVDSPGLPNYVVTVPSSINVTIGPSGTSGVQRVKLVGPGAVARTEVCYTLSAQFVHDDCPWCCYIENCIKLPDCGSCVEVIFDSLKCVDNHYFFKFRLQNGTIYDVTKIQLTSPGAELITFVPQIIHYGTPILPGTLFPIENVQVIGGSSGMTIPIRIKLFSEDFECCYIELTHTFPKCDSTTTGINEINMNADTYKLGQNYPNPFNPSTYISFAVPEQSVVEINIYDVSGRLIENLINNVKYAQGVYSVKFDGSNLPSGMYYYRIKAGNYINTRKMVLIK